MPPRKKSSTPPKKAKTPKKSTIPHDDANEDIPAVPVVAPNQEESENEEVERLLAEALDEVLPDDLEEDLIEFAAEEGEGEGEDEPEQPVEPDDDGNERMDVDEPPAPRGEEDAPAAASGPRLRPRRPAGGAAPPSPAANPLPTPSEALQEMAAITTNWGAQYRTLRDCIPREPKGTWLQGSTSRMTEHTCEFKTLRKFRELSDQTPNDGPAMMKQIAWRWEDRNNSGRVGLRKNEKEKNLRQDLRSMISGERWTKADVQKSKKKRAANEGAAPAAKRPRPSRKDSQRPSQDDEDESSSGSDFIPHDGPAGGGEKTAASVKKNGKAPTTGAASNATQATERTPGRPTARATTANLANLRGRPSMREIGQGVPLPTLGTPRLSAAEMLARQTRSDDGSRGEPMVRPRERGSRGNPLHPNLLSSFSRNMLPIPGRRDPPTQLGGQRPSLAENMVAPSDLRVQLRAAEHDATRADEEAAANMHRYEHSVLTAVDRHREVERIRGMVAQKEGGAEGGGHGKNGDDGEGGGQDEGNGKKRR